MSLFTPRPVDPPLPGEPFVLPSARGLPIRGDVRRLPGAGPRPVVLVLHGFKGFKDWGFFPYLAARLAEAGLVSVTYNASGSGIGERPTEMTELDLFEANTLTREREDLMTVLDAVLRGEIAGARGALPGADPARVGLLGHSRGGGISLLGAAQRPEARCLVTWAGVSRTMRYSSAEVAGWEERGYLEVVNARTGQVLRLGRGLLQELRERPDDLDPRRAVRSLRIPYLILHGDRDEAVPVEEARELLWAAQDAGLRNAVLSTVSGAGHTFGASHPFPGTQDHLEEAIAKTLGWFERWLLESGG